MDPWGYNTRNDPAMSTKSTKSVLVIWLQPARSQLWVTWNTRAVLTWWFGIFVNYWFDVWVFYSLGNLAIGLFYVWVIRWLSVLEKRWLTYIWTRWSGDWMIWSVAVFSFGLLVVFAVRYLVIRWPGDRVSQRFGGFVIRWAGDQETTWLDDLFECWLSHGVI